MLTDEQITNILMEIKNEQHPTETDETIIGLIREAEYDLDYYAGTKINFEKDLNARSLLKTRVLYARFARLAQFEQEYEGKYADLQAKYSHSNIQ